MEGLKKQSREQPGRTVRLAMPTLEQGSPGCGDGHKPTVQGACGSSVPPVLRAAAPALWH